MYELSEQNSALPTCFDKLFSNEHYECFLELINVQTFMGELIYHLEKGSGIVYTALYSKNITEEN